LNATDRNKHSALFSGNFHNEPDDSGSELISVDNHDVANAPYLVASGVENATPG